ncbi:MAG: hypothetical protein IJ688_05690 [Treponema sp.]|nr:hypothetical protein [Treponema sp.]
MGTTIAGNQHIGSNYLKEQYIWTPETGGYTSMVEVYEEDRIFVYQFNPAYDMRDDGVYAIEFYYYYRKPTSQLFWTYFYDPKNFYFYPFVACYNDETRYGKIGKWENFLTVDSEEIYLDGRESGWIHVTLHVEEPLFGRYVHNGQTRDNPLYIGIYSPIPIFCWDNSVSGSAPITPYELNWDFEEFEDYTVYEVMTGGYLEDCYISRRQINEYPSFYITYRDVTPEAYAYSVNEASVMNVTSGIIKKGIYKKLLQEIKAACGTSGRKLGAKRKGPDEIVSYSDLFFRNQIFKRLFSENLVPSSTSERKHGMKHSLSSFLSGISERESRMLFFRGADSLNEVTDITEKKLEYFRLIEPDPNVESEVTRQQILFRSADSEIDFTAKPFASRLFFRTIQTVMSFWDWLRGKIREANNVVTFFCPIDLEINLECKI